MAGRFVRKAFSAINLEDSFFTSLKEDYPGNRHCRSFIEWFHNKSNTGDEALVFEDDEGIGAFICLKYDEVESIKLESGFVFPAASRMKISTIKIADRYRNQRVGEGALGLILWEWRDTGVNEIYVTVFRKHSSLIGLLEKYGFRNVGINENGECVLVKDRRHLDFSDPCKAFPFICARVQHAGCLVIDMDYHDTMFAFSELANTLQKKVDISVSNGLKKVYLGSPTSLGFSVGEPVLIYRKFTGEHGKGFKSCVTGYCIVTKIEIIKCAGHEIIGYDRFRCLVGNKSVFTDQQLRNMFDTLDNLTLIELLYTGYFGAGHNVNWNWLRENGLWFDGHPMTYQYTRDQFASILRRGNVDVSNVVVD